MLVCEVNVKLCIVLCQRIPLPLFPSDFQVKVVDLSDTSLVTTLTGHQAPVLCVKFDPLGHLLVSERLRDTHIHMYGEDKEKFHTDWPELCFE